MANTRLPDFSLPSLRGGLNNTDPHNDLPDDQVPVAMNVEWFYSTVGERRAGCEAIDITGVTTTNMTHVVHLSEWFATNDALIPQQFAVFADPESSTNPKWYYRAGATSGTITWTQVTPADDQVTVSKPGIFQIQSQALNGLNFFAYNSGVSVDRNHVWDGTNLRRTGFSQPNALASVVTHGAGTYSGTRYFRYRVAQLSGSTIIRQSEPSVSTSFTPLGTGDGATLTLPGTVLTSGDSGVTHWLVEASDDDADFYKIATVAIGTTTYLDTINPATGYAAFELSAAIGAYLTQPNFKFLANDGDRLLGAGDWNDASLQSTVYWSPVFEDPGVGNTERQPIVTTGGTDIVTSLSLDNYAGGAITGITPAINGSWFAFKYGRIYMLNRSHDPVQAYTALCISTVRGAIPGSIVVGADEAGSPCIYFLDPLFGPSRISGGGVQTLEGVRGTWGTVNLNANDVICCGCFYNFKRQVHWWIATDGAESPNLKIVAQTSEMRWSGVEAVQRGFSLADGGIAAAFCCATWTEWVIEADNSITISKRPFIGVEGASTTWIGRTDVATTDFGTTYLAEIITKPYSLEGILNKFGLMNFALMATAKADQMVQIQFIRDWGLETSAAYPVDLSPQAFEEYVIKVKDEAVMADCRVIQIRISDVE